MNTRELTIKARELSRCLTYNDDAPQAQAKHMLLEMSHRMDALEIRAHKKADGLLLVNGNGKARYATFKERVAYRLFGELPKAV